MKAALVGRHRLLRLQEKALNDLGIQIVRQIENLPTEQQQLKALIEQLKGEGIEAVVTVALPPQLLASLSASFNLYVFEMKSHTVPTTAEAERWVSEDPERRTYLPGRPGEPVRCLEFVSVNSVRVVIESKRVWP